MKKPFAIAASGSALAALVGLSAWSMTAAVAVTPTPGPAAPAEDIVVPDWSRDLDNPVSCEIAKGTPYEDLMLKEGWPSLLDADGDRIMCESNGDDDAARAIALDPWEGAAPPIVPGYVYPNCDTAYASFVRYPFPAFFPTAGPHLDPDGDGVACETNGGDAAAFTGVVEEVPLETGPVPAPADPAIEAPQIDEVPVGGADTGAAQPADRTGLLVGGSVLALAGLAGLAGAGLLIRRTDRG